MFDKYMQKIVSKISPFTALVVAFIWLIWQDFAFVKGVIPDHGRVIVSLMFGCMGSMYEAVIRTAARTSCKTNEKMDALSAQIKEMERQATIRALKDAVNSMYARHMANGDKLIVNQSEIRELSELTDLRVQLSVNSYTQDRLTYLNSRVQR